MKSASKEPRTILHIYGYGKNIMSTMRLDISVCPREMWNAESTRKVSSHHKRNMAIVWLSVWKLVKFMCSRHQPCHRSDGTAQIPRAAMEIRNSDHTKSPDEPLGHGTRSICDAFPPHYYRHTILLNGPRSRYCDRFASTASI